MSVALIIFLVLHIPFQSNSHTSQLNRKQICDRYDAHTTKCCYNVVQYSTTLIEAEYEKRIWPTKHTLYIALMGGPWGVFCEDILFIENWSHYNDIALYMPNMMHCQLHNIRSCFISYICWQWSPNHSTDRVILAGKLGCSNTCQIWMHYSIGINRYLVVPKLCEKNQENIRMEETVLVLPTPWLLYIWL